MIFHDGDGHPSFSLSFFERLERILPRVFAYKSSSNYAHFLLNTYVDIESVRKGGAFLFRMRGGFSPVFAVFLFVVGAADG